MISAHFQTKRDITRRAKTLQWGGGGGKIGAGGGLCPFSIYVKKGPGNAGKSANVADVT